MLAIKALLQEQKDAKRDENYDQTKEIPRETSRHNVAPKMTTAQQSLVVDYLGLYCNTQVLKQHHKKPRVTC